MCNVTRWIFRPIFFRLGTRLNISDRCTANTSLVASHTSARRRLQYQCRESPGIQGVYLGSGFRHWYSNRTGFSSWEMTLWLPKLTLISQLLYSLWSWLLAHSFIYVFFWGCATSPDVHLTSRYITAHEKFYRLSHALVPQMTKFNWSEWPGHEASTNHYAIKLALKLFVLLFVYVCGRVKASLRQTHTYGITSEWRCSIQATTTQYVPVTERVISTAVWSLFPHLFIAVNAMVYVSLQFSSIPTVFSLHTKRLVYPVLVDTVRLVQSPSGNVSHETLTRSDIWSAPQVRDCTPETLVGAAGGPEQFRMNSTL